MNVNAWVAVLRPGEDTLELRSVVMPAPEPWQVLIEQRATGVCHSQLDLIDNRSRWQPLVIGHESSGTVVAAGGRVTHVEVGRQCGRHVAPSVGVSVSIADPDESRPR